MSPSPIDLSWSNFSSSVRIFTCRKASLWKGTSVCKTLEISLKCRHIFWASARVQRVPWTPSLIFSLREIGESRNYNSSGRHWDERRRCGRGRRKYLTRGNVCSAGYVESTIHEQNYRVSTLVISFFFFHLEWILFKNTNASVNSIGQMQYPGEKALGKRLKGTVRFLKPFKTGSTRFIIKHLTAVCVRVKRNTEC